MLKAIPKHWLSWDFTVTDHDRPIAQIDVSWWREKGELTVNGKIYEVYRQGLLGAFVLESNGAVMATAKKPSALRRQFELEHEGKHLTLRASSVFGRTFLLLDGKQEVGSITPEGFFTRRAEIDLPLSLPLAVRVFIFWLAVILWKRQSDSSASSS